MVRASIMLRQALERLFATGHRRVLIPLCGRIPQFAENCRRQVRESALELGVDPEAIVFAESEYSSPEVLAGAMRQHWRKHAPDALIIFDWREYLAASSFLKETSIAIPRDVSVVLLSHNPTMEWHLPALCHFMHPVDEIARVCAKWVAGGKPMVGNGEVMEFRSKWVEGASIADRTKKARPG
jgi:DNA-binding LacI/PurR family transcriptional regulator